MARNNNPFLSSIGARDSYISAFEEDEDETSVGKVSTSSGNPFLDSINASSNSRIKTKKEQEDAARKKRLDELAQIEANAPEEGKGFLETAGDAAGAVGGFIKDAAVDIKDTTVGAFQGVGDVLQGQGASNRQAKATEGRNKVNQEWNAYMGNLSESDFDKPEVQAKLKEFQDRANSFNTSDEDKEKLKKSQDVDATKTAAQAAETALTVGTFGVAGAGKALAKQGAKQLAKNLAKTGNTDLIEAAVKNSAKNAVTRSAKDKAKRMGVNVVEGSALGAGYGATSSVRNEDTENMAQNIALGAGLGAAVPVVGAGIKAGFNKARTNTRASQKASQEAREAAEDAEKLKKAGIRPATETASEAVSEGLEDVAADGTVIPGSQVGNAVENVATKPGATAPVSGAAPSRYASKTLPESDFVGVDTKKNLGTDYQTTSNAQRADVSLQKLDVDGVDNFTTATKERLASKQITDQTVFDAQAAAQALEKRGTPRDLQDAADIYNQLSGHLSKAGQTVQAAAIMSRQTPQGLSYYAQKQFKNAGVEITPQLQKELKGYVDAVKNAKPKSEEMAIARDNVMYFIAMNTPSKKADKIVNFWRAGLLTAPTTSGGALVGNLSQVVNRKLVTNPVSTLADWTQSFFTKERTQALAKFGEYEKGMKTGAKNATSKQYWKTGFDPTTVGEETTKFDQKNRMLNYGQGALGKPTGKYVNGVYQLMGALDQPFRQGAIRESLSSMASAQVKTQGLKGKEARAAYQEIMDNPPTEMLERATAEGAREVFANDTALSKIIQGAKNKLRADGHDNAAAIVDFFVPFSKVPSAVASRLIDQTPIGTANQIVKQIINVRKGGKYDQRAMSRAIGEGTMALPILGAGYALAKDGLITGGYPSTKEERDRWKAEGKQPNSVKIGDRWYSMNYIQPFGTIMSMGAGLNQAAKAGEDVEGMITEAIASAGKSFINQSFLQGISSGLDAVNNPVEFAGRYVANTAAGIIPNIIRSGVRAADPYQRETEGFEAGIKSGIPGLRDELPIRLDEEGNPVMAKDNFANQYFNPLKPSRATPTEDTDFYDQAITPASRLRTRRRAQINDLLGQSKVAAAQRKIDEYNKEVAEVIAPYVTENRDRITPDQLERIEKLFLGEVWINNKGRPTISSRDDLPE